MSIDTVLALALFLGALWVALLELIVTTTRDQPADPALMIMAVTHFTVLVYFCLAAAVLYGRGLFQSTTRNGVPWLKAAEQVLLLTWPAALIGALVGYALSRIGDIFNPFIALAPMVVTAWWLTRRGRIDKPFRWLTWPLAGFLPYLWIMSLIWANVSVETDRQTYHRGEVVVITVRSQGYVFNPSVDAVELMAGRYPVYKVPKDLRVGHVRVEHEIASDASIEPVETRIDYVRVEFSPQAFWRSRDEYREIKIVP